jgi:hypothetical protein
MTGRIPRPVPPPAALIQPATTSCEQCHSRRVRPVDELRVIRDYANDEANTETTSTLLMKVGGPDAPGIHRHLAMDIEYVAADAARESIPLVRVRNADGTTREFPAEGTAAGRVEAGAARRMDCLDCHNRPAHTFHFTPERAVDTAVAAGRIPRELPFARREAVAAVSGDYPDRAAGLDAIARRLNDFYTPRGADRGLVDRAVQATQEVWSANVFPAMNVTWGTYRNQLGHIDTPGCFRCHDDRKAADGRTISQDCELCHSIQ